MSEQVMLSLIGAGQAIFLAVLGIISVYVTYKLKRLQASQEAVKEQVVNHHSTNLRVEADDRHTENRKMLSSIKLEQVRQGRAIQTLIEFGQENRRRISSLEETEIDYDLYREAENAPGLPRDDRRQAYVPPHPQGVFERPGDGVSRRAYRRSQRRDA